MLCFSASDSEEKRRLQETVAEERQDLEQRKKVNETVKVRSISPKSK